MAGAEGMGHLAGRDLQRGEQIHDAVASIVVRVPHRAARAQREWRLRVVPTPGWTSLRSTLSTIACSGGRR